MEEDDSIAGFVGPATERVGPMLGAVRDTRRGAESVARGRLRLGLSLLVGAAVEFAAAALFSLAIILAFYMTLPIYLSGILLPGAFKYLWTRKTHRAEVSLHRKER